MAALAFLRRLPRLDGVHREVVVRDGCSADARDRRGSRCRRMSLWQLAQNCESAAATILCRSMKSGVCPASCSQRGGSISPVAKSTLMRPPAAAMSLGIAGGQVRTGCRVELAQVAGLASALGGAARRRVGHLVAVEATLHARQLVARRELEVLHRAVALGAADVLGGVLGVVENHVGARQLQGRDPVTVAWPGSRRGRRRTGPWCRRPAFTADNVRVVARVARVALGARRGSACPARWRSTPRPA